MDNLPKTPRQEKHALRVAAFQSLHGKTIQKIDTETPQIDIRFTDGAVLTIRFTDPCHGKHMMLCNELPVDTTLEDLRFEYTRGVILKSKGTRTDLITLNMQTPGLITRLIFYKTHPLTCKDFSLRWKIALTGTNQEHEGAW